MSNKSKSKAKNTVATSLEELEVEVSETNDVTPADTVKVNSNEVSLYKCTEATSKASLVDAETGKRMDVYPGIEINLKAGKVKSLEQSFGFRFE
ncbi:MAG: hypothetical protein HC798_01510 [Polaribacter sp.]|nr:hypothetical protein [Polaribacter sp.]